MGQTTGIEWTDHTFNLVIGCTKVSPGCANCYAETLASKRGWSSWGPNGERKTLSDKYWIEPLKWNKKAESHGHKHKVFCSSLADVFEDHPVVNAQRERLWELVQQTPWLIWQILTKRPHNFDRFLPSNWGWGYPNVWLGVSVENQEQADRRICTLLETSAAIRFLSCEPLLGRIDFSDKLSRYREIGTSVLPIPDWVIVGGESGSNARPMHPDWAMEIRDRCRQANIPFFFKQWGDWQPWDGSTTDKEEKFKRLNGKGQVVPIGEPTGTLMHRVGKKLAGKNLYGKTYSQFPMGAGVPSL